MTCPGLRMTGKAGIGYCQIMYVRVYIDVPGEARVCDYCHADADGKRCIDADVYFVGDGRVRLHSADAERDEASKLAGKKKNMSLFDFKR